MMANANKPLKLTFEAEVGGRKAKLAVLPPSAAVRQHGRIVHARAYSEAVRGGAMIREELEDHLRDKKLWDDERQREHDRVRGVLLEGEKRLARGGMRLKEARQLALDMIRARDELRDLLSQRNRVDANTADAIADQAQFNYFVASCSVDDETGKPVFTRDGEHPSVDDYVEKGTEPVAILAASKLAELMYGSEKEVMEKLPENQFLRRFKFIDDELHLVNDRGQKVDDKGRLVDDAGRFIDEEGHYVDSEGNRVDKEGRFVVDEEPFLDDDGKPIVEGAATDASRGEDAIGREKILPAPPKPWAKPPEPPKDDPAKPAPQEG